MPRRHRALSILVMPIGVFIWIIGWSFYWIGLTKESRRQKNEPPKQTGLTFMVSTQELLREKTRQRVSKTT